MGPGDFRNAEVMLLEPPPPCLTLEWVCMVQDVQWPPHGRGHKAADQCQLLPDAITSRENGGGPVEAFGFPDPGFGCRA